MEDVDIAAIKQKSVSGIVALTSRTFVLQVIAFVATFALTVLVTPEAFGVFYVVSAIIAFLGYFSDIGLAAALIQKREELTRDDLATTFTLQQLLVGGVVVLVFALSESLAAFYGLDISGLWLLRALIVAFFLSSLKTIPSVLLERKLEFSKLVVPQILETGGFYGVAVLLAWLGFGITSFTWAVLVRAIIGLIAIYVVSPWRIRLGISASSARQLLRFGIPFQMNSFLALLKDDLLTVFLGKILPFAEVGYIGWAKRWAEVPLRLIMDNIIRVTFPAYSRIANSRELLGKALDTTLFGLSVTIFPITLVMLFFIAPVVEQIPRYVKWEPALVSFYFFGVASAFASLSTPLTNALNAIGKITVTLRLMILWTIATWICTVLFINLFGFGGVSIALAFINITLGLVVYLVKKHATFSFLRSIRSPIIAIFFQAAFYWLVRGYVAGSWLTIGLFSVAGVILYTGVILTLEREKIRKLYSLLYGHKSND